MLTPEQKTLLAELEDEAGHLTKKAQRLEQKKEFMGAAQCYKQVLYRVRNAASLPVSKTQGERYQRRIRRVIELHNTMIYRAREQDEARRMIVGIVRREPGVLQTELYNRMPQQPRSMVREIISWAIDEGTIVRRRKGRTYALYPSPTV